MKRNAKRHENWLTAITFAEAGEWEIARTYIPMFGKPVKSVVEKIFMAVAFAEEGMADEARRIAGVEKRPSCGCCEIFLETIGLSEAPLKFGLATVAESAARS